jgi:membrane protease YdiL (CAAX protease family)
LRTAYLHLAPAAVAFVGALALAPIIAPLGLPRSFALTVAFALLLTPIELGLLLRAARRATGRLSLRAIPAVLAYRRRVGRWWALVPVLFPVALAMAVAWTPVGNALGMQLHRLYPAWLLPDYDVTKAGYSTPVLVTTVLITLVVDGVLNPTVEELYFRGYLLPRLPVAGWRAVILSAGFFAVQHYWQPYNWLLIFALQLILTALVIRTRSIRFGIIMHVLANSFGILATLFTVLT